MAPDAQRDPGKRPVVGQKAARRLIRWVTYNLSVALIPLIASIAIHWLTGKLELETVANSPELLFFTLVVCATAMADLSESAVLFGWRFHINAFYSGLLLGLIASAILYGCLLYDGIVGPASGIFRFRLLKMSLVLAAVFFALSTIVEVYLGRLEDNE